MKPLRIGIMLSAWVEAPAPPPEIYPSMELSFVIGDTLARRGHAVTFFGSQGTTLPSSHTQFASGQPPALKWHWRDLVANKGGDDNPDQLAKALSLWEQYMFRTMVKEVQAGKLDILQTNNPTAPINFAPFIPETPIVTTFHSPIYHWWRDAIRLFGAPNHHFVTVSDFQRQAAPDLPYAKTIHNGIHVEGFTFNQSPDNFLLYVGRIIPEKGLDTAIHVAQSLKKKLVIIGPVVDQVFWEKSIKPQLSESITYLGHLPREEIIPYYGAAQALLFPLRGEEAFGMVMIEAMACGTPVIAFRASATTEIVVNGTTGFVVSTPEEMIDAIPKVTTIDRSACRQHVIDKFSTDHMVTEYEKLYYSLIRGSSSK